MPLGYFGELFRLALPLHTTMRRDAFLTSLMGVRRNGGVVGVVEGGAGDCEVS